MLNKRWSQAREAEAETETETRARREGGGRQGDSRPKEAVEKGLDRRTRNTRIHAPT